MKLTVFFFSGVYLLLLVCYLFHLLTVSWLTQTEKRKTKKHLTCVRQRKRLKRNNSILGTLLVLSAVVLLSSSYYWLFTEGIKGENVSFTKESSKATSSSSSRESVSKVKHPSRQKTEKSSVKDNNEPEKTSSSDKVAEVSAETEKKLAEEKQAKQVAETQKLEAEKQLAESKQEAEEEEEGDGLPLILEGSFETDVQGVAVIKGKAKKGITRLNVSNSVNDQEQIIEVAKDGAFSFNYEMTDPMNMVILFICEASQVGSVAQEDRQQTEINANPDFMMAYQEQLNAQNEQEYE